MQEEKSPVTLMLEATGHQKLENPRHLIKILRDITPGKYYLDNEPFRFPLNRRTAITPDFLAVKVMPSGHAVATVVEEKGGKTNGSNRYHAPASHKTISVYLAALMKIAHQGKPDNYALGRLSKKDLRAIANWNYTKGLAFKLESVQIVRSDGSKTISQPKGSLPKRPNASRQVKPMRTRDGRRR